MLQLLARDHGRHRLWSWLPSELTTSPNVIWMDLGKFSLTKGSPILLLDPDNINLFGDVTKQFKPGKIAF